LSAGSPLRAPAGNGAVLAEPPLAEVGPLLAANRECLAALAGAPGPLGRPWDDLRRLARCEAVAAARDYLARGGEPVPEAATAGPLLLAGHQPELFHPGVWVKNFALGGLARAHGLTPVNLVVDNDTLKHTAVRVPVPAPAGPDDLPAPPRLRSVPFDRWAGEVPFEERTVAEPALFAGFADRVADALRGWDFEPLLPGFWAEVRRQAERTPLVGECLVRARRGLERAWGCHNLEVPLSALCRTEGFAWFACHLLAELPRFHSVHNAALREYRRRNGLRGKNHPVPDLAAEGDWLEAPFWVWRAGQRRRRRLFARVRAGGVELRAEGEAWPRLPAPRRDDGAAAVAAWAELEGRGYKVRSRALTTTLFARLFLADLFVHGIGGGKYDEITDELVRRFYGGEPPDFLVLSATLWLPVAHEPAAELLDHRRRLARERRDLRWNPQRHLDELVLRDPSLRHAAEERARWVARRPDAAAGRRLRFETLRSLTEVLRRPLQARERRVGQELCRCDRRLAAATVLERRDYSFCLYPAATLRPFLTQFLAPAGSEAVAARAAD
jgi:hypothetical protein